MKRTPSKFFPLLMTACMALPIGAAAQDTPEPNAIPRDFETHIAAQTEQDKERAQMILEVYDVLETDPSPENLLKYLSDTYIQHNPMIPDGAGPLAMMFSATVAQFPAKIDVHKIIVSGDWAMAHVNFRNLTNADENDLGIAAVDMYLFGPDGRVKEHWDVLQDVPSRSANPNGMFLKVFEGE